jgi:hypothetical protein
VRKALGIGVLLVIALGVAVGFARRDELLAMVPYRWNPWAPVALTEPPDRFLRLRLERLRQDPRGCADLLASAATLGDLMHEPVPDRETGPGCGFAGAVKVSATSLRVGEPLAMSCPLAASLVLWERHVLQPAAVRRFGVPVRRLEHYGSYACRGIYHRTGGPRSQHATANAIDVAGFVLADGRRIRVRRDWVPTESTPPRDAERPTDAASTGDAAAALFLRDVRDGACRYFDGVLGPDYNAAHRDHFHFDRGPYRVCR